MEKFHLFGVGESTEDDPDRGLLPWCAPRWYAVATMREAGRPACGKLSHMARLATKATLVLHEKFVRDDGAIMELVIWKLPRATQERPHALKYRLYFGRNGKCLVRYDNEAGKGDHRHIGGKESPYRFVSLARLRRDFETDVRKFGGEDEEDSGIGG